VPYLQPGHYWATDKSRALMLAGHAVELPDPARLPLDHLIQDEDFDLPAIPDLISHAMCFGVFTHLPCHVLQAGLASIAAGLTNLQTLIFTVFLAPPPCHPACASPTAWSRIRAAHPIILPLIKCLPPQHLLGWPCRCETRFCRVVRSDSLLLW
jgi:hypothetical protein